MRLWLILLALVFVGCTTTPPAAQPTLRGAIVPTRVIPTATDTLTPSATPTDLPTELPPTATPTDVPATETSLPTQTQRPSETPTSLPSSTTLPTETATLPPTETPLPSATPAPTETPLPTETATLPPSATPQPSATPAPTETPLPTETPTLPPSATPATAAEPQPYRNATSLEPAVIQGAVELNVPMHGTIDNQHPAVLYSFEGTAGMNIDIEMWAQAETLDPFLLLLDPKGRELVRNDDADEQGNAALRAVILPENGTYVIVATRFAQLYGESSGNFELDVREGSELVVGTFSELIGYESSVNNQIDDDNPPQVYAFRAAAGDVVTIQMTTTSGNLDPNVTLTDNLGTILAHNDDNLLLDTLDSAIQSYIIPRTGYYSILTGRYTASENSGGYRLKLSREGQDTNSAYALLDTNNSATINDAGDMFINYTIGDGLNDQGQERAYQVLLTFILPPPTERRIESASLELAPCVQRGGGFAELGDLTIYEENYGTITQTRNIGQPLPGARVISVQGNCASLDLSSLVQAAYAIGDAELQFRLIFRNRADNGSEDFLLTTPRLRINYAQ